MDRLTRVDLQRLATIAADPAITVYIPTQRTGREVRQNAIRFKNLMKKVADRLIERGTDASHVRRLLARPSELALMDDWWQHQSDTLALFIANDHFDRFRLPLVMDEYIGIGQRFYVCPLTRLLQNDGRFYILSVSQKRVRLLEGSHYHLHELPATGLPSDLRSALNIDEYPTSLRQHSIGVDIGVKGQFHGQGGSDMDVKKKEEILQFFHRLDAALGNYVDDHVPIIFAGVDYLFPLFQQVNSHKSLVSKPVAGNPDLWSAAELLRRSWAVVEPLFQQSRQNALNRYREMAHTGMALNQPAEVCRAARQGQVDTLLVASDRQLWGVVDESSGSISLVSEKTEAAVDLANDAAVHTLRHGGAVYSVPGSELADHTVMAALMRYSVATVP